MSSPSPPAAVADDHKAPDIIEPTESNSVVDEETRKKVTHISLSPPSSSSLEIPQEIMRRHRKKALCKHDYQGDASKEQLSFKKGDVISIVEAR